MRLRFNGAMVAFQYLQIDDVKANNEIEENDNLIVPQPPLK
jgi:hypothetical protein